MTCVSGIIQDGRIYMGADSQASCADETRARKDLKIFKNSHLLIGYCGSFAIGQMLQKEYWKPPTDIHKIVPSVKKHLEKNSLLCSSPEDGSILMPSEFLIGYKRNRILKFFEIQIDFQLAEYLDNFSAIGSGRMYALASLYETREIKDPKKRILRSLECAAYFSPTVGQPFHTYEL